MLPEREVDPPSSIRHQKAYCVCRQIHAQTAATHHTLPTGTGGSSPDVRQGALGGRRAGFDVAAYCFVAGPGILSAVNSPNPNSLDAGPAGS